MLSGRRIGGQTALEIGLVNRAVEQNETGDAAYRDALILAREILPQVRIHCNTLPQLSDAFLLLQAQTSFLIASVMLLHFTTANHLCFLFIFLSALASSTFSFSLHVSLLPLFSLQASVVLYFFHSTSNTHSRQGQSGCPVEKWTTNSTTGAQTDR